MSFLRLFVLLSDNNKKWNIWNKGDEKDCLRSQPIDGKNTFVKHSLCFYLLLNF